MKILGQNKVSGQLLVVMALILGFHSVAYGKKQAPQFSPMYKVENCDCFGFSEDIPTFLSTLADAEDVEELYIFGEGNSLQAAEQNAKNLCLETYRSYASVSHEEDTNSVIQSGCTKLKSTPDGRWVSL